MIKQKPYQSRTFKKCLDIIEQLRYDLDKYIGMWRSQCNIAEEVMKERDRYKTPKLSLTLGFYYVLRKNKRKQRNQETKKP